MPIEFVPPVLQSILENLDVRSNVRKVEKREGSAVCSCGIQWESGPENGHNIIAIFNQAMDHLKNNLDHSLIIGEDSCTNLSVARGLTNRGE